jgi:hypothetical protein
LKVPSYAIAGGPAQRFFEYAPKNNIPNGVIPTGAHDQKLVDGVSA